MRTVSDVAYEQDADGTRQALTVYAPAKGGPWPTAVMIHGWGQLTPRVLPGSTHEFLSEAALRIVADAIADA